MTHAKGRYWGSLLTINPHEALMQQGLSFTASRRVAALANDGVTQIMLDVTSAMHVNVKIDVGGDSWVDFSTVGSYTVGAGSSLSAFNRNTEFEGVNSFSSLLFHTTSIQAGSLGRFNGVIPGGSKVNATGGRTESDEIHLHTGIYQIEVTNKSGAAIDVGFNLTWEEEHKDD
jgi:hypothetical protein